MLTSLAFAGVLASPHALRTSPSVPPIAQEGHAWTQAELERIALEIQADIEGLRGQKFREPVKVRLAARADLRKYVEERTKKTETPEKLEADARIGKLLGVIPPELDVMAETLRLLDSQVVGFYDPDSDSFSLMDSCPVGLARMTMAHELGHALDDQLYGIDSVLAGLGKDTDAQLAYWCVVEGSATILGNRWQMANASKIDAESMEEATEMMKGAFNTTPQWLWKPMVGSYLVGSGFLQRREDWMSAQLGKATSEDIAAAFTKPPASTEMALHPAKYWDSARRDEPRRYARAGGELPQGWKVLREDTLGELACAIVALPPASRGGIDMTNPMALMGLRFTNDAAKGWDGDRVLLAGREGAHALRWRSVWDTPKDAEEFRAALASQLEALRGAAGQLGSGAEVILAEASAPSPEEVELTVLAGVDPAERAALLEALRLQLVP